MKLLASFSAAALLALAAPAFADKTFNEGNGGSVDCAKDANVTINAASGTYTLTGACKHVTVNGNEVKLNAETIDMLHVNGNKNVVTVGTANAIHVSGNDNKVTYKAGGKEIHTPGTGNKVEKGK
jgi:phage baseplate assembly protein gpV